MVQEWAWQGLKISRHKERPVWLQGVSLGERGRQQVNSRRIQRQPQLGRCNETPQPGRSLHPLILCLLLIPCTGKAFPPLFVSQTHSCPSFRICKWPHLWKAISNPRPSVRVRNLFWKRSHHPESAGNLSADTVPCLPSFPFTDYCNRPSSHRWEPPSFIRSFWLDRKCSVISCWIEVLWRNKFSEWGSNVATPHVKNGDYKSLLQRVVLIYTATSRAPLIDWIMCFQQWSESELFIVPEYWYFCYIRSSSFGAM